MGRFKVVLILSVFVLVYLLSWHLRLGLVRYFDIDEYAYLHWAYNLYLGQKPFTDFFLFIPPYFLYLLSPLFLFFGRNISVLIAARVLIFVFFLLNTLMVFLIGKKMKNTLTGLLAAAVFAFLPMPFDKMIEVRPDLISLFFALLGFYLLLKNKYLFLSGASLVLSVFILPKTAFFLFTAILFLLFEKFKGNKVKLKPFVYGFVTVVVITLILIYSYGSFRLVIYDILRVSQQVHGILGAKFFIPWDFFFRPNDVYYGTMGINAAYILNLVIYVLSILWAIFRLKNSKYFLLSTTFLLNTAAFLFFFPLKHAQYLILIAPFAAIFFADLVMTVVHKWKKLELLVLFVLLGGLCLVSYQMNSIKMNWNNRATLEKIQQLLTLIPKDKTVFDLTGKSVFFKQGYYYCCLPYGQYAEALQYKMPDLKREMDLRGTDYVFVDNIDRLKVIPAAQEKYIRENFKPILPDESLWGRKY